MISPRRCVHDNHPDSAVQRVAGVIRQPAPKRPIALRVLTLSTFHEDPQLRPYSGSLVQSGSLRV